VKVDERVPDVHALLARRPWWRPAEVGSVPIRCQSHGHIYSTNYHPLRTDSRPPSTHGSCSLDADRSIMSVEAIVLYPLTLPGLVHFILTTQAGTAFTTLIICSSRDAFLHHFTKSLQGDQCAAQDGYMQNMASPSLHNLLTTRHVKLAFCASVQALLAYLTVCGQRCPTVEHECRQRIVLVNPLALHASTLSFSAQGLSRSFAAATETAIKLGAILQIVECPVDVTGTEEHVEGGDVDMENGEEESHGETNTLQNPWEQEVSILNVSARRFGYNSDERAWAGRTVKAKRIAARWFRFQKVGNIQNREGRE
jgi:hypothetical protein